MGNSQLSMFGDQPADKPPGKAGSFSISRTIDAAPQQVFDQWLIPVFIGEWMFGRHIQAEKIVSLHNTVRRGGEFSYVLNRRGEDVTVSGEYLELDIPRRLAFSWRASDEPDCESSISVEFQDAQPRTRLKLSVKYPGQLQEQRDRLKKRWTARCAALAARFKSRPGR